MVRERGSREYGGDAVTASGVVVKMEVEGVD